MKGDCLRFYVHEGRRLHGKLLYRWLLETAENMDITGGSAFRALAGFGRHGIQHEEHFFELAGDLPVMVVFDLQSADADALLDRLADEGVPLFYVRSPIEFGVVNDGADAPS